MPYSIRVNSNCGIFTVSYRGNVDLAERISATNEICRLVETREKVRILVDVRNVLLDMSLEEQEQFGRFVASRKELESARVAVLHKSGYNPNVIIDTFAYLNGYDLVAFHDDCEARDWLKGEIK